MIDDGSPDQCDEICDEYACKDCRVRFFHTMNNGLSASRNLGLRKAKGKYIGFVDSDDWIEPDMFEKLHSFLTGSGADICVCGFCHEFKDGNTPVVPSGMVLSSVEAVRYDITGRVSVYVWNRLYRKGLFSDMVFPEGRVYEDLDVSYRLALKADKIAYI